MLPLAQSIERYFHRPCSFLVADIDTASLGDFWMMLILNSVFALDFLVLLSVNLINTCPPHGDAVNEVMHDKENMIGVSHREREY
jgi:hypothetical protein